jgi:hypothetical protein
MLARAGEQMVRPARRPNDWKSLNQAVAENPNDLEAKCELGAMLLQMARTSDRERGRKMLAEVVGGDRADQAERARKLLAEPEKYPAIADDARSSTSTANQSVSQSPTNAAPIEALEPEDNRERARREFLQQNFAKFIPAKFDKDGPQVALFQRVPVKDNMFDYEGWHYCGFRFTTPAWMDGDLQWMFILAKTEAQKDFTTETFGWNIIRKSGRMKGFETFSRVPVANYKNLAQRFPYTEGCCRQNLPKAYLKPGEEYAIWFRFKESDLPDIAFALTIRSLRGYSQLGILPLQ